MSDARFHGSTSSESGAATASAVLLLSIWTSSSSPSGFSGFGNTALLPGEILKAKQCESNRLPAEKRVPQMVKSVCTAINHLDGLSSCGASLVAQLVETPKQNL